MKKFGKKLNKKTWKIAAQFIHQHNLEDYSKLPHNNHKNPLPKNKIVCHPIISTVIKSPWAIITRMRPSSQWKGAVAMDNMEVDDEISRVSSHIIFTIQPATIWSFIQMVGFGLLTNWIYLLHIFLIWICCNFNTN